MILATADSVQETSVRILWTLYTGVIATNYTISYFNTNNTQCFNDSDTLYVFAVNELAYRLTGLQDDTEYSVTITVTFNNGSTVWDSLTVTTIPAG